jgi:MOSC domain-containing protein YiiM
MKVASVNVGLPREVTWKGITVLTGIFKEPAEGAVPVNKLNLAGDRQADLSVHGGPAKAVYAYPEEHYEYWKKELPEWEFSYGNFGENLTIEGLSEGTLFIGDVLKVGSAILTVTQPRMPCYKLQVRFDRDDMVNKFLDSGRSGFYFSVRQPGEVHAGSAVEILERDSNRVSVSDILQIYLHQTADAGLLQRMLNVTALPQNWKDHLLHRARS